MTTICLLQLVDVLSHIISHSGRFIHSRGCGNAKSNVLVLVLVLVHIGNATAYSGRGLYTRRRTHCAKNVLYRSVSHGLTD